MSNEPRDESMAPGGGKQRGDAGATERPGDRDTAAEQRDEARGPAGADAPPSRVGGGDAAGTRPAGGQPPPTAGTPEHRGNADRRAPAGRRGDEVVVRYSSVRRAIRDELASDEEDDAGPTTEARPVIELRNVFLAFNQPILEDVSFVAREGETVVVVGESGTGKSTTLKLILRLLVPDKGKVYIDDEDITELSFSEALQVRQKMGMVFQGAALFDSMTVFENIAYPLREHTDMTEDEIEARVREKLEFVDLDPDRVMSQLPSELSGGMRKRVGIARGMANNPEIMLYDEPTSGLDPLTTGTITRLIMKLQRELGVTSVVVSHDIRSAFRMATNIALLSERRITFFGSPEEMAARDDEYIRDFLGGF